jgi:hypothetical protein
MDKEYDPDAQVFFHRYNTPEEHKEAINKMVLDAKESGLWDKCDCIFPFGLAGGANLKVNASKPQQSDLPPKQ